ncbi:MAG: hypothetical protein LBV14_02680, partial [Acidovorax sp.]|nr:hypothetical protein [Acidovorax sp.]
MHTTVSFTARLLHRPCDRSRPGRPTVLVWLQTLLLGMVLWLLGSGWAAAQTVIVSPATLTLPYAAVGVRYSMPVEANRSEEH